MRYSPEESVREYIVGEGGELTRVILDLAEYERLIERLEELEDIQAYDEAKAEIEHEGDEAIPLEQAMREIRSGKVTGD
jgi:PHD/YefM family antitoxin component YafN of YafNO toxin-antitoxin module